MAAEFKKEMPKDLTLISYCGFYCGACPKYQKNECSGCKGDTPHCALGYSKCQVRPCCIQNNYSSCAQCEEYQSPKDCKKYNPMMIRFGQFITRTRRRKAIELIKKEGEEHFIQFMIDKKWVTYKI